MTVSRTICLGFIAVIVTGAMLLMMPFSMASGQWNDPIVALFTSTSAVCVTGHVGYEVILEFYLMVRERRLRQKMKTVRTLNFQVAITTTIFLLLGGTLAIWAIEIRNPQTLGSLSLPEQVLAAWFQSVTARTAGFNTIDQGKMTIAGMFVTIDLLSVFFAT